MQTIHLTTLQIAQFALALIMFSRWTDILALEFKYSYGHMKWQSSCPTYVIDIIITFIFTLFHPPLLAASWYVFAYPHTPPPGPRNYLHLLGPHLSHHHSSHHVHQVLERHQEGDLYLHHLFFFILWPSASLSLLSFTRKALCLIVVSPSLHRHLPWCLSPKPHPSLNPIWILSLTLNPHSKVPPSPLTRLSPSILPLSFLIPSC